MMTIFIELRRIPNDFLLRHNSESSLISFENCFKILMQAYSLEYTAKYSKYEKQTPNRGWLTVRMACAPVLRL